MSEHAEFRGPISLALPGRGSFFPQVPRQHAKIPAALHWSDSVLALLGIAVAAWFALLTLGSFLLL